MAITHDNFSPRPGLVNKQGYLPDPVELVCIEVPKVFDQCLIKRCLKFKEGPDTHCTDEELRSNPLREPKRFLGCRDFNIKLLSVDKIPINGKPGYKKVIISFMISFFADFLDTCGTTQSELFEVNRTEVISRLYCPDSIAKTTSSNICPCEDDDEVCDSEIIKLELVADCLDGVITKDCQCCDVLDITLGFHLIVKCELVVQLLVPAYGYCPVPKQCKEEPAEDPCELFCKLPPPKFYPDQKLRPLFSDDYDDDCGCN